MQLIALAPVGGLVHSFITESRRTQRTGKGNASEMEARAIVWVRGGQEGRHLMYRSGAGLLVTGRGPGLKFLGVHVDHTAFT